MTYTFGPGRGATQDHRRVYERWVVARHVARDELFTAQPIGGREVDQSRLNYSGVKDGPAGESWLSAAGISWTTPIPPAWDRK